MKVAYLTVDLDFWWADKSPVDEEFVDSLIRCFPGDRCVAAFDHHHVLPHTARYWDTCNVLVNHDWHNDLAGYATGPHSLASKHGVAARKPELNCGTWCDHVWWKDMDTFVWSYPTDECASPKGEGRCDSASYAVTVPGHTDWRNVVFQKAKPSYDYNLMVRNGNVTYSLAEHGAVPVVAMSFVWSRDWAGDDAKAAFYKLIKRHDVHVIDGACGKITRKQLKS